MTKKRLTKDGLCCRCANKPEECVCAQNDRAMREAAKRALDWQRVHGDG